MQYLVAAYEAPEDFAAREADKAEYWAGWRAYSKALREAGVLVEGNPLKPPQTATTLRAPEGKAVIDDGPFADAREQLGGYYVIEVDDLDTALRWAARAPCAARGAVEVRPVLTMRPR